MNETAETAQAKCAAYVARRKAAEARGAPTLEERMREFSQLAAGLGVDVSGVEWIADNLDRLTSDAP